MPWYDDALSTGASFSGTSLSYEDDLSTSGGVTLFRPPSNFAASDAVLRGRTVSMVEEDELRVGDGMFREGEAGTSAVLVVPRVFSHEGGFCDALLVVDCRRLACEGVVGVSFGVSFGLSGELLGVDGRTVEGEPSRMDPGLRKGDCRGLLKERGEGLYGVGVVDLLTLAICSTEYSKLAYHGCSLELWSRRCPNLQWCCRVWVVLTMAAAQQRLQTRQTFTLGACRSIDKPPRSGSSSRQPCRIPMLTRRQHMHTYIHTYTHTACTWSAQFTTPDRPLTVL